MTKITPVVKQLLIINFIFYIGSTIVGDPAYRLLSDHFPANPEFHFWQPLTSMFMHMPYPGIWHIAFNMYALYMFGSMLEHFWGGTRFIFFYISCGLGASLLSMAVHYFQFHEGLQVLVSNGFKQSEIMDILGRGQIDTRWQEFLSAGDYSDFLSSYFSQELGASGAIYGLLIAFAFMFPDAGLGIMFLPFSFRAKYFVPTILMIDLVLGLKGNSIFGAGGTGIAHFAHLGGALVGFIMMWIWRKNKFNHRRWN